MRQDRRYGSSAVVPFDEPDRFFNGLLLNRPLLIVDEAYPTNVRGEQPGMASVLQSLSSLTTRYEPNVILTFRGLRYMYMPLGYTANTYGNFLLALDYDWNTPFYDLSN